MNMLYGSLTNKRSTKFRWPGARVEGYGGRGPLTGEQAEGHRDAHAELDVLDSIQHADAVAGRREVQARCGSVFGAWREERRVAQGAGWQPRRLDPYRERYDFCVC